MLRQILLILFAVTACLALGDGRPYYNTKNVHQKQAPQQYSGIASYNSKPSQPEIHHAPSPYSFGYEAEAIGGGGSSRQESSDASGKVTGSYKVTNEDGSTRVVKYVADEQGFRADVDTNEPGTKSDSPADVSFNSAAVEAAPAPNVYASAQGHSQSKPYRGQHEQKPIQFTLGSAGSDKPSPYSFNYESQLDDGSNAHSETSDGSGKVTGYYSLSVADGRRRKVDYSAGNEGFRATVDTNEFGTKSDSPAHVQFYSSSPQAAPAAANFAKTTSYQQQKQTKKYSQSIIQQAPIQQQQFFDNKPSPYSFNYDAQLEDGSSSRTESADGSGKVVGSYSLSASDGRKRTIDYEADQAGFRASVNTNEFGTKSDSPASVQFLSSAPQEAPAAPKRAPVAFKAQKGSTAAATQFKSFHAQQPIPASGSAAQFQSSYQPQASVQYSAGPAEKPSPYSFNYFAELDDGSSSRSESADENGKVTGSYSLAVADGRHRTVDYVADHEGFRASVNTNEFGTKSDSPADVQFYSSATFDEPAPYSSPNAYKASSSRHSASSATTYNAPLSKNSASSATTYNAPLSKNSASSATIYKASYSNQEQSHSPIHFTMGSASGDKPSPYSFNYQSQLDDGSNAHSETSDGSGKVTGFYSLSVADGRRRKVDYSAGSDGFRATVDTNEFGTKSDSPANVQFLSSAPQEAPRAPIAFKAQPAAPRAPVAQQAYQPAASAGLYKASAFSQQQIQDEINYPRSPYSFNYEADATGGSSARQESADADGKVTGSYTVTNEDGSVRVVEYIADKDGFRANVNTNEPGTKSDNPADVTLRSDAKHSLQQSPVKAQFPDRTYTPKSSMISQKPIDSWRR